MNPSIAVARPQNLMQDIAPPRPAQPAQSVSFAPSREPAPMTREQFFAAAQPAERAPVTPAQTMPTQADTMPFAQPEANHPTAQQREIKRSAPILAIILALAIAAGLMVVAYLAYKNSATLSANL